MRKIIALLLAGILLAAAAAGAENVPIRSVTELGALQQKLDEGAVIGKVYYTDGYEASGSGFTTDDPEEIGQLWNAVNAITVGEKTDESVTDRYPQIVFCLTDGTRGGVRFEGKWLCIGKDNYEVYGAEEFRALAAALTAKHAEEAAGAVRAGVPVTVEPVPADPERLRLDDGTFCVQIEEMDRTEENGYLSLSLYLEDRYDPEQIRNLAPGDGVLVAGRTYTVKGIEVLDERWYEDEPECLVYDIATEEENWEGLRFREAEDGFFTAFVGDWSPVTRVGGAKVSLPLPAAFAYYDYPGGDEPMAGGEEELLADLREGAPELFSPYNTTAVFRNGELLELHSHSYPWGPSVPPGENEQNIK